MADTPRLIEAAFPLRQASLDSVREKYGPRGHISGFHLWPAGRLAGPWLRRALP
jgi:putative DNA methylase